MEQTIDLRALAPEKLRNYRVDRYYGDEHCLTLEALSAEDNDRVRSLYDYVQRVYATWLEVDQESAHRRVVAAMERLRSDAFLKLARKIGSGPQYANPAVREVLHDIRGGALTGILGFLQLADLLPQEQRVIHWQRIVILCRDHAKIMRNLIKDLDPSVRLADEEEKLHPIQSFIDTWSDVELRVGDQPAKVETHCTFEGYVTNRCLETSSVDRVLYNYLNNAARFTADGRVRMDVLGVDGHDIRWVVSHRVDATQTRWLAANAGSDLGALFAGGITRGGHGIGLRNCAEIVGASYGVSAEEAIVDEYLGAKWVDERICFWFHWPAYRP